ncbi:hypothetical protein C0Q70_08518 [Pomacea canaliculata]|uniref:Uncharacterized protein n=1 Tax=Pomacea canaliculata TaxID=400727 RepID=A0A2T7PI28_POMCA|nr:hypothetical protein C0Q70_08518 [Pomacea canaliculata]
MTGSTPGQRQHRPMTGSNTRSATTPAYDGVNTGQRQHRPMMRSTPGQRQHRPMTGSTQPDIARLNNPPPDCCAVGHSQVSLVCVAGT